MKLPSRGRGGCLPAAERSLLATAGELQGIGFMPAPGALETAAARGSTSH